MMSKLIHYLTSYSHYHNVYLRRYSLVLVSLANSSGNTSGVLGMKTLTDLIAALSDSNTDAAAALIAR